MPAGMKEADRRDGTTQRTQSVLFVILPRMKAPCVRGRVAGLGHHLGVRAVGLPDAG